MLLIGQLGDASVLVNEEQIYEGMGFKAADEGVAGADVHQRFQCQSFLLSCRKKWMQQVSLFMTMNQVSHYFSMIETILACL
jgi:hypothetical protein